MSSTASALLYYTRQAAAMAACGAHPHYVNHFNAKAFLMAVALLSTTA